MVIEFEGSPFGIHLINAVDEWNIDILPDLVEEQRKDLEREIALYYNYRELPAMPDNSCFENRTRP